MSSLSAFKRARDFISAVRDGGASSPKFLSLNGKQHTDAENNQSYNPNQRGRQSKRERFRHLVKRKREPRPRDGEEGAENLQSTVSSSPPSPETVQSPRSIHTVNSNKPLPSPPPPGSIDKADGVPKERAVLKLKRIMSTLGEAEIEKLFSGAPQYFCRSQGINTGAPCPSVAFPWNDELYIRDLTDHTQIGNEAWGCVTASPRIIVRPPMSATTPFGRARPHFNAKCRERPSMLSMQGLEKGSVGYQAALELGVADALQEDQYGFDSLGTKSHIIVEQRQKLVTSKNGLRHLDDAAIMERLLQCEGRYQADRTEQRSKTQELYNDLFLKLLYPPTRVIDHNDPYSLAVQVYALVKVLAAPNAWYNFSHVEWRIRLGQILWGFELDDELNDGSSINEEIDAQDRSEERYWLLVQLLLACELLIRLDAITEGDEYGGGNLKAGEIHRFEKEANTSVKWSLLLARTWMENITISKTEASRSGGSTPKGWLTSLTSKMSLKNNDHMYGSHHDHNIHGSSEHIYTIQGRYTERQVMGLVQFARKLRWPEIESYVEALSITAPTMAQATPINSPLPTSDTSRSSYFGDDRRPANLQRNPSRRRKVEAALHPSGWLSKSYISGLVLPGEALSHFLMSTLLENDHEAMERLGPMANLCGGFVYSGKSFWSTACVVGRVLAAGQGSAECMGWVSSDVTPNRFSDRWLNIDVDEVPNDAAQVGKKARIWGKTIIERESDVLGDADSSDVLPADFILPHENTYAIPPPSNIQIEFRSLDLAAPTDSVHATPSVERDMTSFSEYSKPPEIQTYPASMAFMMMHDGIEQGKQLQCSLASDVNFVTAHPCVPSSYVKLFKSPSSPTIERIDVEGNDWSGRGSSPAPVTGHPLHKYYSYVTIHLTELLDQSNITLDELLEESPSRKQSSNNTSPKSTMRNPRVLVIDCITGFAPPKSQDMAPLSRMSSTSSSFELNPPPQMKIPPPRGPERRRGEAVPTGSKAPKIEIPSPNSKMKLGTRKRKFGSDLEILVRAVCAERGWNALISRRRRGCLACTIREAGALGWKVIIRVD